MTPDAATLGRILLTLGVLLALAGGALIAGVRLPLGRLPGDITAGGGGVTVSFPIVTCLVVSVVLTIVLNLVIRR